MASHTQTRLPRLLFWWFTHARRYPLRLARPSRLETTPSLRAERDGTEGLEDGRGADQDMYGDA